MLNCVLSGERPLSDVVKSGHAESRYEILVILVILGAYQENVIGVDDDVVLQSLYGKELTGRSRENETVPVVFKIRPCSVAGVVLAVLVGVVII